MTPEQVAALEAAVARNPDDRESREKLLVYYGDVRRKLDPAGIAARRAHILWMIEHHPDVDTASSWSLRLYTIGEDSGFPDPFGDDPRQCRSRGVCAGEAHCGWRRWRSRTCPFRP